MARSISFERQIPVRHKVDVFVAGGGPAGIAAALAASRQGARVFLAEGHSCFGGMGTAGLVPAYMCFGDSVNFYAEGLGREILDRLYVYEGTTGGEDAFQGSVAIRAEVLKRIYDDLVVDSSMAFSLHTQLVGVDASQGKVNAAICWGKSGMFAVEAAVYVDCTGDGDLAAWAGASFEKGDVDGTMMPGTLCTLWTDIEWETVGKSGIFPQDLVPQAIKDGVFTVPDKHLPGIWRVSNNTGGGNIGHTFGVDATDERSLTKALIDGRKRMAEYQKFYQEYVPGYQNLDLVATGSLLGVRETRRITGDYVLCLDDFKSRAVFDDEIGRYNYPVDIHPPRPDDESFAKFEEEYQNLRYRAGESYGIPYRSLTPTGLDNVLVAGRCISSDRFLQGSVRVMPGCYITGQAAGVAAALSADRGKSTHRIDVTDLLGRLSQMGAYLPNFSSHPVTA